MKMLFVSLLLAMSLTVAAQQETIVYATFAPEDNGIGTRIDIQNGYVSMAYGNYRLPYGGYIKDHVKLSMGALYKNFSLGLTYHEWGDVKETVTLYKYNLRHLSFEAGGKVYIGRFVAALRYDVLRSEGTIDFGFKF